MGSLNILFQHLYICWLNCKCTYGQWLTEWKASDIHNERLRAVHGACASTPLLLTSARIMPWACFYCFI